VNEAKTDPVLRPLLICRRLLRIIDDQNLHRPFLRFKFQTQLLLYRGEDRRPEDLGATVQGFSFCVPSDRLHIGVEPGSGVH